MSNELFSSVIQEHVARSRSSRRHSGKLLVLSRLLEKLFSVELEELIPGIESRLGSKLLGLRGSIDLVFADIVFEIKVNLDKEISDAEKQLLKYFQVLHEKDPARSHIAIATDCIKFIAYTPEMESNRIVGLHKISSLNIAEAKPSESVLWLDSFVFAKPKIAPSAIDLRWRFGPDSPTYSVAVERLGNLWDKVWNERDVALKLDLWAKNMEIVYGSRPTVASFIDHTFLVTLVKLIVFLRLNEGKLIKEEELKKALTGEYFSSYGIANLIEKDFFAWILHSEIIDEVIQLVHRIAKELARYDLSQMDEDFFKEIYQEIVKPSERHRIGEYYTPEWLVESILDEVMGIFFSKHERIPSILDPACGSGTFLCNALRKIKRNLLQQGKPPTEVLTGVLENVVGVDINPLAVVIARANYVLALGDLLKGGGRKVIPIYVADSIKPPNAVRTLAGMGKTRIYEHNIEIRLDNQEKSRSYKIQIPENVVADDVTFDKILDCIRSAISSYFLRRDRKESLEVFAKSWASSALTEDELSVLNGTLLTIFKLIDEGNDTIWGFMLSNLYAPIALLKSGFDIVCGNPPWIAMRYVENKNYQDFLKARVMTYDLLGSDQVSLFTHMEMATLFFCRVADLYLDQNSLIAFVMPRSVLTGALHHIKFKKFKKPRLKLEKIFDLEEVSPLFNVPSCVLIGVKGQSTSYPVPVRKYSGGLAEKNLPLSTAIEQLSVSEYSYNPPSITEGVSSYHDKMREGASLVPRSLWFVDLAVHGVLGVDVSRPFVRTSKSISHRAKKPWKEIGLEGNVEVEFLYTTLLGGDLVPFGFSTTRALVLPLAPSHRGHKLFDVDALRRNGFLGMAEWLDKAQQIWERRRTEKAKSRFPRILTRLDYNNLLSCQNPHKQYVTLYNASGTNLVSCVVNRKRRPVFSIMGSSIRPSGFVADHKSWFYESNLKGESHYLCAVLNSDAVNNAIKPFQTRGLWGERDIHRRPFMLPIPKYKYGDALHNELADLSQRCHKTVANLELGGKSVAKARKEAKESVSKEIERIDELVRELLKQT